MTGWELRARRERLGLTLDLLADRLGVREGTLRHWEKGRDPVPYRVPHEIADLEAETAVHVEHVRVALKQIGAGPMPETVAAAVIDQARSAIVLHGLRWWRHVVIDAATLVPGADFVPMLRILERWETT